MRGSATSQWFSLATAGCTQTPPQRSSLSTAQCVSQRYYELRHAFDQHVKAGVTPAERIRVGAPQHTHAAHASCRGCARIGRRVADVAAVRGGSSANEPLSP